MNRRIYIVIIILAMMIFTISRMFSTAPEMVDNGRADLSRVLFDQNKFVTLDGNWEFYRDRLLTSADFSEKSPQMNSLMKVPGSWNNRLSKATEYQSQGVATYRLRVSLPPSLDDPAIQIQHIVDAYKLYANGRLITEVGTVSEDKSTYRNDEKSLVLELPKNLDEIELIFQVASLKYAGGGLRQSPIFGSKKALEDRATMTLVLQMLFMGSAFVFSIYYFLLFLFQKRNKAALLFSLLCFITVVRSSIWGGEPILIFFPDMSFDVRCNINFLTGFNLIPVMMLFIFSFYPMEYKKKTAAIFLIPTLILNALLLFPEFISSYSNYIYLVILLQLIYLVIVQIKAVLNKRDYSVLMLGATCTYIVTITADIFFFVGIGNVNLPFMFLFGNFAVIIAMSVVQARQQADIHKRLALYNENLIEADQLKDKIIATEMSFLQAQIKPHFLYNALNAIANVSEKDGKKASKLIIDLAIYLRGSLEFNNLDKMTTIEKELEFVDTYFNIEEARFGEKIHLQKEIEIPLSFQIPVLIIQPLVENAVRHGITKKPEGGTVYLRMSQTDEGILMEIEDDGVGIEGEKLALLLGQVQINRGVGLLNIHHRLNKLYRKDLVISSEVGQGTQVKFVIPKERTQEC